ncbi:MAG: hypothetical protein ACXWNQ_00055 [Anaerolineales bacterium]
MTSTISMAIFIIPNGLGIAPSWGLLVVCSGIIEPVPQLLRDGAGMSAALPW